MNLSLGKVLDRFTPLRLRVWYGRPAGTGFLWSCNRCARHHNEDDDQGFRAGGWTRTLAGAQARAKQHQGTKGHRRMRVVYEKRWR